MNAREEVLARVRQALSAADGESLEVVRAYRTRGEHEPGAAALLELLTDRLEDYKATVHRCDPDDVGEVIESVLRQRDARRLAVPSGFPNAWLAAAEDVGGIEDIEGIEALADGDGTYLTVEALDQVDAVVTACAVAIAETGTIVLDASPDQGRRILTLVPDCHVVVVRAPQVVQTVPEAITRLDPHRPLTWISGPSATSDIELSRVEGVHGPRTLIVVLVEP